MAQTTKFEARLARLEGKRIEMRRKIICRQFTETEYRAWLQTSEGREHRSAVGGPLGGMILILGDPVESPSHAMSQSSDSQVPKSRMT